METPTNTRSTRLQQGCDPAADGSYVFTDIVRVYAALKYLAARFRRFLHLVHSTPRSRRENLPPVMYARYRYTDRGRWYIERWKKMPGVDRRIGVARVPLTGPPCLPKPREKPCIHREIQLIDNTRYRTVATGTFHSVLVSNSCFPACRFTSRQSRSRATRFALLSISERPLFPVSRYRKNFIDPFPR